MLLIKYTSCRYISVYLVAYIVDEIGERHLNGYDMI